MNKMSIGKKGKTTRIGMVLVVLITMITGFAQAQSNLVTNPGFETSGASGWTETTSASIYKFDATAAGEFRTGTKARGYWCNTGSSGTVTLSQTINSVTGGFYTAVIWSRKENYGSAFTYATFKIKNGGTTLASGNLPTVGSYQSTTLSNINIAAGTNVTVEISFELPGGNGYVTVDDASFLLATNSTPTFSIAGGTYGSAQSVALACATSGATIRYTLDGSTPSGSSTAYSGTPLNIAATTTVKAIAFKTSVANSAMASATYTIGSCTAPGAFSHSSPANGATAIARTTTFTWGASANATSYTIVVSTNSGLTSPIINQSGITGTSFNSTAFLAANTLYYWRVTAVGCSSTNATTTSFTTTTSTALNYYVATTGNNSTGNGTPGKPWLTVSYAASQVDGGAGHTINVGAGTFSESSPVMLNPKVNLDGAGQASTTITKSGSFDVSDTNFNSPTGSLIQLVSTPLPSATTDGGGQIVSDLKVDGSSRTVKAGVWVQNRRNVTMTNVTITNTNFRGAVFSPGYKDWYMEPQYYMTGININNCTFTNTSKDVPADSQSLGALNISGLDGANIYNITINENQGYGIKFIYDGYFKNTQIHDCTINVPETDTQWGEDIAIEFWNAGANNQIYNITCNTWLSLVNHAAGPFNSATSAGQNLKVYGVRIIDGNASSGKEAVEAALPGLEIYNSYFQNKGFGIAVWDAGGKHITVRNCTFYNSAAQSSWASGAVYIDNSTGVQFNNINVYNNIFDAQNNAVNIKTSGSGSVNGVNIKNNAFLNGTNADVTTSGSSISNIVFTNNLKGSGSWSLTGVTTNSNNVIGSPGYQNTGNRYDNAYYAPSSSSSFAVAKGTNVGLPYSGTAPDIGRYEWTGGGGRLAAEEEVVEENEEIDGMINSYPNPTTTGIIRITASADSKIENLSVTNAQGKIIINRSLNQVDSVDLDLSQQTNDMYIVTIKHQKGITTRKIIVLK